MDLTQVLLGVHGYTGNITFNNLQNLSGGNSNNIFNVNGSIDGSITGGSGNNTLVLPNSGSNYVTITGANSGIATGVNGGYSNINTIAGNSNSTNTYDFSFYGQPTTITLGNSASEGTVVSGSTSLGSFTNASSLIGASTTNNVIYLPQNVPLSAVTYSNSPLNTAGTIGDPVDFSNFTIELAPVIPVPPTPPSPSPVITPTSPVTPASTISIDVPTNVTDYSNVLINQLEFQFQTDPDKTINKSHKGMIEISPTIFKIDNSDELKHLLSNK